MTFFKYFACFKPESYKTKEDGIPTMARSGGNIDLLKV